MPRPSFVSLVLGIFLVANAGMQPASAADPNFIADLNLHLVTIPAGTFVMGSDEGVDERPRTTVTLSSFRLGQTEITQAQWKAIMGTNPSKFQGAQLPVEQVSYTDAIAFTVKLTARERAAGRLPAGHVYTLPTEAQWEYACRAATTGDYAGDVAEMAWYEANSQDRTHPVATKRPNAWGVYDMHGNVWEWCLGWKTRYPGGRATDPAGPKWGSDRIYRGGACTSFNTSCRSWFRIDAETEGRAYDRGFRIALSRAPMGGQP